MPQVDRTLEIKARPSVVWKWFESQQALQRWLRPNIEIDLQVGGSYTMLGSDEETTISGAVLEIVPEGRLILSWFEEDSDWVHPARLVLELTPVESGTLMRLSHDGFAGIGKSGWINTVAAYERGADRHKVLEGLAAVVESGA